GSRPSPTTAFPRELVVMCAIRNSLLGNFLVESPDPTCGHTCGLNSLFSPAIFRTLTPPSQQKSPNFLQNLEIHIFGFDYLIDIMLLFVRCYDRECGDALAVDGSENLPKCSA